jgi:hypothetical protein
MIRANARRAVMKDSREVALGPGSRTRGRFLAGSSGGGKAVNSFRHDEREAAKSDRHIGHDAACHRSGPGLILTALTPACRRWPERSVAASGFPPPVHARERVRHGRALRPVLRSWPREDRTDSTTALSWSMSNGLSSWPGRPGGGGRHAAGCPRTPSPAPRAGRQGRG